MLTYADICCLVYRGYICVSSFSSIYIFPNIFVCWFSIYVPSIDVSLYTCPHLSIYMRHSRYVSWSCCMCVPMSLSAPDACSRMRTYTDVCWRMLPYASMYASRCLSAHLTHADVCWPMLTYAAVCFYVCVPMPRSASWSTAAERALRHDAQSIWLD